VSSISVCEMLTYPCACSFFQEAQRIVAPDYLPVESDVLRARIKTTGIYETRFKMGQLSIQ
jgi:guanine nucleotide-binding protein G(i) subunit alpha